MGMATSKDEWLDAAYDTFTNGGLGAVRVESLARDLGTTKGSFYWHFADRAELVGAVMTRWEHRETQQLIDVVDAAGPPAERLAALFAAVASRMSARDGEMTLYVSSQTEGVADIVTRVSQRRIDYIAAILRELDFDEVEARNRGTIALAAVLGLQQLTAASELVPDASLTEVAYRMVIG